MTLNGVREKPKEASMFELRSLPSSTSIVRARMHGALQRLVTCGVNSEP